MSTDFIDGGGGTVVLILLAFAAIWLAFMLLRWLFVGAVALFRFALDDYDFPGFVVYTVLWVTLAPLMVIVSILTGAVMRWIDRKVFEAAKAAAWLEEANLSHKEA